MSDKDESNKEEERTVQYVRAVYVGDANALLQAVDHWHRERVKELNEILDVGPEASIEVEDGSSIPITGDFRKGFHMGLQAALMHLGTLPYVHSGLNGANDAQLNLLPYKLQTIH